jgi:Protein of unknown function (DUF4058)
MASHGSGMDQYLERDLWPIQLANTLPNIPLPLLEPDEDVPLDLSAAVAAVYDEAAYDLSLDYNQSPPPPTLSTPDQEWVQRLLEH